MRIIELKPVSDSEVGRIIKNDVKLEPHEYETIFHLTSFGFDIELVKPSNVPHSKNPDLEMQGTSWEMKGPKSPDKDTITTKFRKAVKQSGGRAIYDLRGLCDNTDKIEKYILELFRKTRGMKRLIIIEKNGRTIDIIK